MARRLMVLLGMLGFGAGGLVGRVVGHDGGPPGPLAAPTVSIVSAPVPAAASTIPVPDTSATAPVALPGWLAFVRSEPAPTSAAAPAAPPTAVPAPTGPITYTVQPGDTLTGIARWFELHGYRDLYEANRAVIGADPNLIFPGQTITVGPGTDMQLGGATAEVPGLS